MGTEKTVRVVENMIVSVKSLAHETDGDDAASRRVPDLERFGHGSKLQSSLTHTVAAVSQARGKAVAFVS